MERQPYVTAKKMQTVALTATSTMLPAFAALAAEDVTPIDLRLAAGYTIFLGRDDVGAPAVHKLEFS